MVMGFWEIPIDKKVYESNDNEIILEPSLKFISNLNMIVAIKAFGAKANCLGDLCKTPNPKL